MDMLKTPVRKNTFKDPIQVPASPFLKKIGYGTGDSSIN